MSFWRKTMVYLGLGPDEEYDEYAPVVDDRPAPPEMAARPAPPRPSTSVRPQAPVLSTPPEPNEQSTVRAVPMGEDLSKPRVRAVPRRVGARPMLVEPTVFAHAQEVADHFKQGRPVAMDLADADRDLARRLIDFSSGLCYGLGGQMQKLGGSIYLVIPTGVEVSEADRAELADGSFED